VEIKINNFDYLSINLRDVLGKCFKCSRLIFKISIIGSVSARLFFYFVLQRDLDFLWLCVRNDDILIMFLGGCEGLISAMVWCEGNLDK
jgi:hypothetical protein